MGKTLEAIGGIFTFPRPRRIDGHGDGSRKDPAQQAAQKAYKTARYNGPGQSTPTRPYGQKSSKNSQKTKPDAQFSNRKPSPVRNNSYLPQPGKTGADERDQQDPNMTQLVLHKSSAMKPTKPWGQGEDEIVPIARGPPIGSFLFEPGPSAPALPRMPDDSQISGPWQDKEPWRIDNRRPDGGSDDSSAVIGRLYHHLRRVKREFPSAHFGNDIPHPCSPIDIEMAMQDLFRAYGSVYQSAQHFETSLENKKAEQESLQKRFQDDWADKSRDYEVEISKLKIENDRERNVNEAKISLLREEHESREQRYDERVKQIQKEHQSEKDSMSDRFKGQIQWLENEMGLMKQRYEAEVSKLGQQHREQVTILDSAAREEMARAKTDFDNQMIQLQESLRVTKEHYGTLLENMADQYEEEKREMGSSFNKEKAQMNHDFQSEKARLTSTISSQKETHGTHLSNLRAQHEEEKREMASGFEAERKQHDEEKRKMASGFNAEKTQLNANFQNEKGRLSSTIQSQKESHGALLSSLRKQHEDDKKRMTEDHELKMATLEKGFDAEKAAMEKSIQATKDHFHMLINNMEDEHNHEINKKATEVEMLKKAHKVEEENTKALVDADKAALVSKWEQERKLLKDDAEALKVALVRRDHFKAMSDHELALRFQDLVSEVDEFSRVRWDNRCESTWPFPDKILRKSENERRTKQHIVENTIWVILYERIFCTPFRVLGNEGKKLEGEWVGKYGQDRKSTSAGAPCAIPTEESEKWRYETIKKCLEAISQPLLEWESNFNLKRGYELCLREAMEDFSRELGRVAPVSGSEQQRMSDLVRKAAKLWLEIGQQRYRIFLVMSESGERPLRSGQASIDSEGRQALVAVPELRRMGNAQGKRLERDELVSDCRGIFSAFNIR